MFEVIFSTNNLSGMHISTMWHSLNVLKYFCPLSVCSLMVYILFTFQEPEYFTYLKLLSHL